MAQDEKEITPSTPYDTAQDAHDGQFLVPATVTALRRDAGGEGGPHKHPMERSFSQDIQEGSRDLKEAAEQTRNIILDLSLDGIIRWVSPSWTDVVGTRLEAVKGQPISRFIADDPEVFTQATETLKSDDSKSKFVKFSVKVGPSSELDPMLSQEQKADLKNMEERDTLEERLLGLEGQGIMVYDRVSGGESHVRAQSDLST